MLKESTVSLLLHKKELCTYIMYAKLFEWRETTTTTRRYTRCCCFCCLLLLVLFVFVLVLLLLLQKSFGFGCHLAVVVL